MKKIRKILLFVALAVVLTLTSCYLKPSNSGNNNQNNQTNDINEITNKTIEYKNISVEDLQTAVTETAENLKDAVIGISLKATHTSQIGGSLITSEDTESIGSGVIYKREEVLNSENKLIGYNYYVVTNRHVITGSSSSYQYKAYAYLGEEDVEIEAEIIGSDPKVDIALVKFQHTKLIQPVEFADSDTVKKGQFAIAIGNPDGYEYYGSVTFGIVSGELRYVSEDLDSDGTNDFTATYIQHDVTINPGNSGGGLFTIDGKLIGINTMKIVDDKIDNMGFAIPSNVVKSILEKYLEVGKTPERPRIGMTGIAVRNITNAVSAQNNLKEIPSIIEYSGIKPYGIYVVGITGNSSISNSPIKVHDIILEFDGIKLTNMNILSANLNGLTKYFIGTEVEVTYYSRSQNKVLKTKITLK